MTIVTRSIMQESNGLLKYVTPSGLQGFPSGRAVEPTTPVAPAPGNVLYREFDRSDDAPALPGFRSIDDVVARSEAIPLRREALERARKRFAKKLNDVVKVETLSTLRLEKGWSQKRFASEIGTSQSHFARIEAGTGDPQLSTIVKIAEALEKPLAIVVNALASSSNRT